MVMMMMMMTISIIPVQKTDIIDINLKQNEPSLIKVLLISALQSRQSKYVERCYVANALRPTHPNFLPVRGPAWVRTVKPNGVADREDVLEDTRRDEYFRQRPNCEKNNVH